MARFAARMDDIQGSATVEIADLVAKKRQEGANVLSFSLGEPDFDTPKHVRDAAKQALDEGHTHYTPGKGIPALRDAIANYHQTRNQIPCTPDQVIATPTKQAVMMALQAVAGPGDEVLLPNPGWVSYAPATYWAGAKPVEVPLMENTGFRMTPEAVAEAITPRTNAIVLNSPANPTGGTNLETDVKGIVELAIDNDLWILSDEIYQELLYEGEHVSAAALDGAFERTITIDGLSKSFAMTGWRTGWLVGPDAAVKQIGKLQSHSVTHVTSFAQYGAVAALTGPQDSVHEMRAEFQDRRDLIIAGLRELPGVTCATPKGAFYVFPKFDPEIWGGDDQTVCRRLIEEAGVATTPGSAFGSLGAGHLRFSYATSKQNIAAGIGRMAALVA